MVESNELRVAARESNGAFDAVALDHGSEAIAAVLLLDDRGRSSSCHVVVCERSPAGWDVLFTHTDEWIKERDRSQTGPPLAYTTSVRGDSTSTRKTVLALAGVTTPEVSRATIREQAMDRPVAISPESGAFVLAVVHPALELRAEDAAGAVIDQLIYTPPPTAAS